MKVRFIGLVFHAIIVGFAVIILRIMHFVFHAGSDVIGLVVLITAIYVFVNLAMDWFANQPLITRLVARHFVTSDFCKTFEIEPPPPNDWLAMKVSQRIVTDKLTELKRVRNDLRKDENAEISKTLDPNDVYERIADNRGLHARVEAATRIYATASWTAQLFSFEVQVNE